MFKSILTLSYTSLALALSFLFLTSCSLTPTKKTSPTISQNDTTVETVDEKQIRINELEQDILSAKKDHDWEEMIKLSHQLWSEVEESNQVVIEFFVWDTIRKLPDEALIELEESDSVDVQDWLALVHATKLHPVWQKQALADLKTFYLGAPYTEHLIDGLTERLEHPLPIQQIAVLLPLSGIYEKISLEIRNGMIRNQMLNAPDTELRFYDSSEPEQVLSIYRLAKQKGAEIILGPLQKESIAQLEEVQDPNLIVLNSSDAQSFFSYVSSSEPWQISQQLCQQNYHRIAILSSTNQSDTKLAQNVAYQWKQSSKGQLTLKTYPEKNPNLRKALGSVINEEQSQYRKNNLQWLLRENLEFEPRTRKDLEAILLLGNNRQIAVFKPQFDFFELALPVYSSSKITPAALSHEQPNGDLEKVIFPSFPAALSENDLQSKFEAFGWDSFTLATKQNMLAPRTCLNSGQTGRLFKDGNEYDRMYIWAKYDRLGKPVPLAEPETENGINQ